jgi:hypothetical protein
MVEYDEEVETPVIPEGTPHKFGGFEEGTGVKLGEGETAETAPLGGDSPEALEAKIKALEKEKEALGEGVVMVYTTGDGDERKVTDAALIDPPAEAPADADPDA